MKTKCRLKLLKQKIELCKFVPTNEKNYESTQKIHVRNSFATKTDGFSLFFNSRQLKWICMNQIKWYFDLHKIYSYPEQDEILTKNVLFPLREEQQIEEFPI